MNGCYHQMCSLVNRRKSDWYVTDATTSVSAWAKRREGG